jgi:hypothetical protein
MGFRGSSGLLSLGLISLFCSGAKKAHSQEVMTGYVAPIWAMRSQEGGSRTFFKVEFARLTRYISLDLRYGQGLGYQDYGGTLRFFRHWSFGTDSGTGVSAGLGIGATSSSDFIESFVNPFVRGVWDTRYGFGIVGEFGFEPIIQRNQQKPFKKLTTPKGTNLSFGIGLAVSA